MGVGSSLLELQEIDLTLMRDKEQLQNLPEIAELARRRKLYLKLKGDSTKLYAQRKDVEIDLQDLDVREQKLQEGVEQARREVDMDDYRQVQQLEITLAEIQEAIDKNERKRSMLFDGLDSSLAKAYEKASKQFGHLAVEKLEGNVPSICRMSLQSSSMSDLRHADEVTECPYCHRLMVILPEE